MSMHLQEHSQSSKMTATNFDLPSLHLLRPEIEEALHNAELHLSEFNDDDNHAPLLLDSSETLEQVAKILSLISLSGASELAKNLADGFQYLYHHRHQNNNEFVMDISEGIMTLNRYTEFVLLKETVEPSLLLPILNKLNQQLGKNLVDISTLISSRNKSLAIANPEQNFQSLQQLGIHNDLLIQAYRAGLSVVLTATTTITDPNDIKKLQAMQASCKVIANRSDSLFWQAVDAVVSDLIYRLPITLLEKRVLIFVEQQFNNYIPINDSRFADLVSLACQRNSELANKVQQKFAINGLNKQQLDSMRQFLFGPNREVTDTVNSLIQEEIDQIKIASDKYARENTLQPSYDDIGNIVARLQNLSSVLRTLNLNKASQELAEQATKVQQWTKPTPEDFDSLLSSLMVAENSAIYMAKTHTPGAVSLPLYNQDISLHQLDTAYVTLIQESRNSVANIESAFNEYLADDTKDVLHLVNVPEMMRNIAGACLFLNLSESYQLLQRASTYMDSLIKNASVAIADNQLAKLADVVMAVDYYLESLEVNKPAGTQALKMGQKSLQQLLAN